MKIKILIMLLFINLLQADNGCNSDVVQKLKEICIDNVCISGTDESHVEKFEFTKITTIDTTYTIKHENIWMNTFKEYTILSYHQKKIQFLLLYDGNPYVGIIFELRKKNGKYAMSSLSEIGISKDIAHICKYNIKNENDIIDFTITNRKKNFIAKGCRDEKNFSLKPPLEEVALILKNKGNEKRVSKVVKERIGK